MPLPLAADADAMTSVGISRKTGKVITGWERTLESVTTILETEIGDRVQRRDFGSNVPSLIDRPSNVETVMDLYMAIAESLEPRIVNGRQYGEPCFAVTGLGMAFSPDGKTVVEVSGDEYPNGHKGDFSPATAIPRVVPLPIGA